MGRAAGSLKVPRPAQALLPPAGCLAEAASIPRGNTPLAARFIEASSVQRAAERGERRLADRLR